ncbi:MAG: hypothetical protein AAB842_00400 [Patescibacteria group bacterium]
MANNIKPKLGALIVAKPGAIEGQILFAEEEIVKYGFEILAKETILLTDEQITKFYGGGKDGNEWEKNLGEKISSSCINSGIDILTHFGTTDVQEIGALGKKMNENYLKMGKITVLLIGPNRHNERNFFSRLSEAVEHFRFLFCEDTIEKANKEKRAFKNVFHLTRTPEEFSFQYDVIWSPE